MSGGDVGDAASSSSASFSSGASALLAREGGDKQPMLLPASAAITEERSENEQRHPDRMAVSPRTLAASSLRAHSADATATKTHTNPRAR